MESPLALEFWLPVLSEALQETNDLLRRRVDSSSPLNGKRSLLLLARKECKELLRHIERLLPPSDPPK